MWGFQFVKLGSTEPNMASVPLRHDRSYALTWMIEKRRFITTFNKSAITKTCNMHSQQSTIKNRFNFSKLSREEYFQLSQGTIVRKQHKRIKINGEKEVREFLEMKWAENFGKTMAQNLRGIHQLSQAISYAMPKQATIWLAKKTEINHTAQWARNYLQIA